MTTYQRRRSAGLCVTCAVPTDGSARCPGCATIINAKKTQERNALHAQGLCTDNCGEPTNGRGRCFRCSRYKSMMARKASPTKVIHCGICEQPGHNRNTCEDEKS